MTIEKERLVGIVHAESVYYAICNHQLTKITGNIAPI